MRKEKIAQVFYSSVLILAILASAIQLSPARLESPYNFEQGNKRANLGSHNPVQPIIYHVDIMDKDFDGIQDSLENMIPKLTRNKSALLPVVVTLYNPVLSRDLDYFKMLGGRVTHVYRNVTYGFAGVIPAANVSKFASFEEGNLCVIERDVAVRYHMDVSVSLIRARPTVWDTYGYTGSPNHSIAILDSGIDDSHLDVGPYGDLNFSRKIVGWYDATSDNASAPEDYSEHGTHCAGIAAGTGDANPLQASGFATTTLTDTLSGLVAEPRYCVGYLYYGFDVMNPGVITLNLTWTSDNRVWLQLRDATGQNILGDVRGSEKPLILNYNATESGRYRPLVGICNRYSPGPPQMDYGSGFFSLRETYPYQESNDAYNLFTGVAPTSKLVGVKVFDNTGSANASTVYGGMDWVLANKDTYNITVVSMSIGLAEGEISPTFDQKADTMVENGIVTCVSAGNDFPNYTIGSPGTAAYVITVAATNDQNGITFYSSNGNSTKNEYGLIKPDVAAPGGSTQVGNLIISADSNDVDFEYSGQSDYTPNDHQQMMGTSMSAPHVSGLAALIIDALPGWNWTKDEALKVKMIISMTAFEVQDGESSNVSPLNRGDKDSVEGYGRICADAAVEAATMTYTVGELATDTLGSEPSDKKVWARQVSLWANQEYEFNLSVPSGADYDLYLYNGTPDAYGQPVILAKSINATVGAGETISCTPSVSGTGYILVKWVSGNGQFDLESGVIWEHDVEVVNVTPSTLEVYEGNIVNITVLVKNNGGSFETFNVTVYIEDSAFENRTVTSLAPAALKNLTFSWNTTGFAPCHNYTIRAEADVVSGEIDTADNIFIDGKVKIVGEITGDIDGDHDVDFNDFVIFSGAYGTSVGEQNYDSRCDLNFDGYVDFYDFVVFSGKYGKKC